MSVWPNAFTNRHPQPSTSLNIHKVHRLSRVIAVPAILLLALSSLPLVSQISPDPVDTNSPRQQQVSGIGQSGSPSPSPYAISVSRLQVPEKAASHLEMAQKHFAKMQLAQARTEIDRAIDIYPVFVQAFCMKALVQLAEKNFAGSVESAAHAISLDGTDAYSWIALATAFNSLKEWPEAEAAADRALALNPSAWQGRLELAKSYYGEGKFALALRTLDQVSQNVPDIHLVRANALMRLGRSQEAAQEFWIFLQETPADSRAEQIRQILSRVSARPN